jgi:hypothetical protein
MYPHTKLKLPTIIFKFFVHKGSSKIFFHVCILSNANVIRSKYPNAKKCTEARCHVRASDMWPSDSPLALAIRARASARVFRQLLTWARLAPVKGEGRFGRSSVFPRHSRSHFSSTSTKIDRVSPLGLVGVEQRTRTRRRRAQALWSISAVGEASAAAETAGGFAQEI